MGEFRAMYTTRTATFVKRDEAERKGGNQHNTPVEGAGHGKDHDGKSPSQDSSWEGQNGYPGNAIPERPPTPPYGANQGEFTTTPLSTTATSQASPTAPTSTAVQPLGAVAASHRRVSIIIGSVIGALVLTLGCIFVCVLVRRRRSTRASLERAASFKPDRMVAAFRFPSFTSKTHRYSRTAGEDVHFDPAASIRTNYYDPYAPSSIARMAESPHTTTQPVFLIPVPYSQTAETSTFVALPERQLELQEQIFQTQQMILQLDSRRSSVTDSQSLHEVEPEPEILEARKLKARIRELERLKDSSWARGLTDVIPRELMR